MRKPLVAVVLVPMLTLTLGACASSHKSTAGPQPASSFTPAGPNPSASATMICAKQAQTEVAGSLGVKATSVTAPTWSNHVYTCSYVYPNAQITLSVKEMSSNAVTAAYFNQQGQRLGRRPGVISIGQGGFQTTNGDVVVRKDWKVLTVDISKVPANFGNPTEHPADVALSVSETILGCWTGT